MAITRITEHPLRVIRYRQSHGYRTRRAIEQLELAMPPSKRDVRQVRPFFGRLPPTGFSHYHCDGEGEKRRKELRATRQENRALTLIFSRSTSPKWIPSSKASIQNDETEEAGIIQAPPVLQPRGLKLSYSGLQLDVASRESQAAPE